MIEKYISIRKRVLSDAVFVISGCAGGILLIFFGIISIGICIIRELADYLLRKIEGS